MKKTIKKEEIPSENDKFLIQNITIINMNGKENNEYGCPQSVTPKPRLKIKRSASHVDKSLFKSVGSSRELSEKKKSAILNIIHNKSKEKLSQKSDVSSDTYQTFQNSRDEAKKKKYIQKINIIKGLKILSKSPINDPVAPDLPIYSATP